MKYIIATIIVLISYCSYSQYHIVERTDEMTGDIYHYTSEELICEERSEDTAFALFFNVRKKSRVVKIDGIQLYAVGFGCLEDATIYFLFEDGTRFDLTMWNKFNCDGKGLFKLNFSQREILANKEVKKIRVVNFRNNESYTHELETPNYFIKMSEAVENKLIKPND